VGEVALVKKVRPAKREKRRRLVITSSVKRTRDFMVGLKEQVGRKARMVKDRKVGLLVEPVIKKVVRNHVEEKMLQREEREDADQLVPLVKLTKEGRGRHELA